MVKPLKVVFIVSSGYSGSTLLDLILGSHSEIVGLGELDNFDQSFNNKYLCTCLKLHSECYFWNNVRQQISFRNKGLDFKLKPAGITHNEAVERTIDLYEAVATVSNVNIIVDSSKNVSRTKFLQTSKRIKPYVIYLIRDGRGVGNSHLKRGESFKLAIEYWIKRNQDIIQWLHEDAAPVNITIRYEELATHPIETIAKLCKFLSIKFEHSMISYRSFEHHNISGNIMRFRQENDISLDEEWRTSLTEEELDIFKEVLLKTANPWFLSIFKDQYFGQFIEKKSHKRYAENL